MRSPFLLSLISVEISQAKRLGRETRTTTFDLSEIAARARFAAKAAAVVSRLFAAEIESGDSGIFFVVWFTTSSMAMTATAMTPDASWVIADYCALPADYCAPLLSYWLRHQIPMLSSGPIRRHSTYRVDGIITCPLQKYRSNRPAWHHRWSKQLHKCLWKCVTQFWVSISADKKKFRICFSEFLVKHMFLNEKNILFSSTH